MKGKEAYKVVLSYLEPSDEPIQELEEANLIVQKALEKNEEYKEAINKVLKMLYIPNGEQGEIYKLLKGVK